MLRISQAISEFPRRLGHSWFDLMSFNEFRERLRSKSKLDCEQLVYFGKLLHEKGFVSATDGNLSVRLDDDHILATPTAMGKAMMRVRDMVLVDGNGVRLKGRRNVSSEICISRFTSFARISGQLCMRIPVRQLHLPAQVWRWTNPCVPNLS